jgi:hypothetical protein
MKSKVLKVLTFIGKAVGIAGAFNTIPGLSLEKSVIVFFVASLVKDVVNRIGDFLDDGKSNDSFKY